MKSLLEKDEREFLTGPRSRWKEFLYTIGVVFQFHKAFRALHFIGPSITVFGSARFKEDHPFYTLTRNVSAELSKMGFAIVTGGGPGLMEASNRGARDAKGLSIGCNIVLPKEQSPNPYLDAYVNIDHFFVRKEILRKYSFAFVVMPGGFGTLDEFFETITLIQTKKIEPFPVIIMGKEFHKDLLEHIEFMAEQGTISKDDLDLVLFSDDVAEVVKFIHDYTLTKPNLKLKKGYKPIWILGEKKIKMKNEK
ncbi:MAG: TIGR00730 family Rossman fold protein [Saprospiraceae bacterium]